MQGFMRLDFKAAMDTARNFAMNGYVANGAPAPAPDSSYTPRLEGYGQFDRKPQLLSGNYVVCIAAGQPRPYADSETLYAVMVDPQVVTKAQIEEWAKTVWPEAMKRFPQLGSSGFDGIGQTYLDGHYFADRHQRLCWVVKFRSIFTD
jgi:hypothetical protein